MAMHDVGKREWMRRIGWMVLLWLGGVLTLSGVAFLIRMIMHAAGMR
jgi:hypothetical protein